MMQSIFFFFVQIHNNLFKSFEFGRNYVPEFELFYLTYEIYGFVNTPSHGFLFRELVRFLLEKLAIINTPPLNKSNLLR